MVFRAGFEPTTLRLGGCRIECTILRIIKMIKKRGECGCRGLDLTQNHLKLEKKTKKEETSSPKGNDAHLRVIIQSEKKWKHQFFRRLRAANSVVLGRIWPNFILIQALMYDIITCKYEKDPIKNNREKEATPFFKL